jgi:hypothetical protein
MGHRRTKPFLTPLDKHIAASKDKTPAASMYQVPTDNIYFKKNKQRLQVKEQRFFRIQDMERLKAALPLQYTSIDGVSPRADELSLTKRGTKMSMYFGGGSTSRLS